MQFKLYVRAFITNSLGQVLLAQKRINQRIAAGQWMLPGGTVEFGETPIDTLRRELAEEANFQFEKQELIGTETMILEETHWLGLYYRVSGDVSGVKNLEPEKHEKLDWCEIDFAKSKLTEDAANFLSFE